MGDLSDDTADLLERAARGDVLARQVLLSRHRERLRRAVVCRLDRRLAMRVDPSDVVQDALLEASQNLDAYLRDRPIPLYPWLRRFACERVSKLHRYHLGTQRRSVAREQRLAFPMPAESGDQLAEHLFARGTSPSLHLMRAELREHLLDALAKLSGPDQEVLCLRHLEQMDTHEIAATLGISEGAVRVRHLRALQRLRAILEPSP
jgi:RNA polymerase sigma-70 factor (ECF subfamily)